MLVITLLFCFLPNTIPRFQHEYFHHFPIKNVYGDKKLFFFIEMVRIISFRFFLYNTIPRFQHEYFHHFPIKNVYGDKKLFLKIEMVRIITLLFFYITQFLDSRTNISSFLYKKRCVMWIKRVYF